MFNDKDPQPSSLAAPISLNDFQQLFKNSNETYRTALMIAWHSGTPMKQVLQLTWPDIDNNKITIFPELDAYLKNVPRTDSLTCPGMDLEKTANYVCQLFIKCGIFTIDDLPVDVFGLHLDKTNLTE